MYLSVSKYFFSVSFSQWIYFYRNWCDLRWVQTTKQQECPENGFVLDTSKRKLKKKTTRFVTRKVRQLGQMIFFPCAFLFCSSSKILNTCFFPFDIVHSTRLVLVKLSSYRFANLIHLHPYTIEISSLNWIPQIFCKWPSTNYNYYHCFLTYIFLILHFA